MSRTNKIRRRAHDFLKKGKPEKAVEEYRRLLQRDSNNPNVYNELGDIYIKISDKVQAISCFEKAVEKYEKVSLYNNATAVCKKILRIVPDRLETLFKLGELRAKQRFESDAEKYFNMYLDNILVAPDSDGDLENRLVNVVKIMPGNYNLVAKISDVFCHLGSKKKAMDILSDYVNGMKERGQTDGLGMLQSWLSSVSSDIGEGGAGISRPGKEECDTGREAQDLVEEVLNQSESKGAGIQGLDQRIAGEELSGDVEDGDVSDRYVETGDTPTDTEANIQGDGERGMESSMTESVKTDGSIDDPEMEASKGQNKIVETDEEPDWKGDMLSEGEKVGGTVSKDEQGGINSNKLAEDITSDVEEDDYKSHYDLGMAYLEMALYSESIKEFQIASRSEILKLKSFEMIGYCFILNDNPRLAVKQLSRGLKIAESMGGEKLGLHYNLGLAYEMMGEVQKAKEQFEEVYIVDVTFKDIEEKMKKFSPST